MTSSSLTSPFDAVLGRPLTSVVTDWVSGWVVSRGASEPAARPWGWTIDVGQQGQVARHVVVDADGARVREAADRARGEGWWLKVFLPEPCDGPEQVTDGAGFDVPLNVPLKPQVVDAPGFKVAL